MQKNEGSPLRKSVNCAGKWTASDISKKGRSISNNNKNEEKGYRKAAECYPRAEVANVSHTIAQKGAFNSEKKVTPLALPSPGAVKVNHFSDSLFAPTPPLPPALQHCSLNSNRIQNPFKWPNLNLLAARDSC